MKLSTTGQEKGDCLIEVTARAGLTVCIDFRFMVLNTTFNNISVTCILWWSLLLVEETGVPRENHRLVASH
jgi:hypothetical protein